MIPVPAKILSVDKLGDQYLLTVQVGREKYKGTFDRLNFGENKPHFHRAIQAFPPNMETKTGVHHQCRGARRYSRGLWQSARIFTLGG